MNRTQRHIQTFSVVGELCSSNHSELTNIWLKVLTIFFDENENNLLYTVYSANYTRILKEVPSTPCSPLEGTGEGKREDGAGWHPSYFGILDSTWCSSHR
jgi:hypothetical protein